LAAPAGSKPPPPIPQTARAVFAMPKITDPDHRLVALKAYEFNQEALRLTTEVQAEYGRWLIATTSAVQVGAIFFVGNLDGIPIEVKLLPIWIFVAGLLLILFSGLAAWANWGILASIYRDWNNANMLVETSKWPKPAESLWIPITYWLSLIFGIASALCIPLGAAVLTYRLQNLPT
jgi:hypothetical protein